MIWIPATILLIVTLLLLLPMGLELMMDGGHRRIRAIIAGVRIPLRLSDHLKRPQPAHPKQETIRPASKSRSQFRWWNVIRSLDLGEAMRVARSVRRILRCFRIKVHRLQVTIASPDPAVTGFLYGMSCALTETIPALHAAGIGLDFQKSRPVIRGRVEFSIIPVRALAEITRSLWIHGVRNARLRRAVWNARRSRRRNHV